MSNLSQCRALNTWWRPMLVLIPAALSCLPPRTLPLLAQSPVRIQAGEKGATLMVLGDITPLLRLQTAP